MPNSARSLAAASTPTPRLTTTALASLYLQGTNVPFIADKTEGGTIVCDDRKYA